MKTYNFKIGEIVYQFFYDPSIRSWTIYEIDKDGNQQENAEHFPRFEELFKAFKVRRTNPIN